MIKEDKLQEVIKFIPHKGQVKLLACKDRFVFVYAGRRWGKSAVCAYMALKMLMEENKRIWIVAPTYGLTEKVFYYLGNWYQKAFPSQTGNIKFPSVNVPGRIVTPWGSIIECKSADSPKSLLGEEVDLLILDEAASIPREVWENQLLPVTSSRKGRIIGITTPWGKGWYDIEWIKAKVTGGSFHFTSLDGVSVDKEEWDLMKRKTSDVAFKQNYMAIAVEGVGSFFSGIRNIIRHTLTEPKTYYNYVIGIDLAKIRDYTVITVIDTFTRNVVHWDRIRQLSYPLQKLRIKEVSDRYNKAPLCIDATSVGDPIADDLERMGMSVERINFRSKKEDIMDKLRIFIEQKAVFIPNNEILIDELEAFKCDFTVGGHLKLSAPDGLHDDAVDSLALAVWLLQDEKARNPATSFTKPPREKIVYQYN